MISFKTSSSGRRTETFLNSLLTRDPYKSLERFGQEGVEALARATPTDSGETANSWSYEILKDKTSCSIIWSNSHMAGDTPVAVLIQHGHGTGTGGYVQGRDFINPALRPLFDRIAADVWKEVTSR